MKAISVISSAVLLLSTLVAAAPSPASDKLLQQPISGGSALTRVQSDDDDLTVPGSNPLFYCDTPQNYLLDIQKVDLDPNPPKAGSNLTVKGSGLLKDKIENGAKVRLSVKYGLVKILTQEVDLCEQASIVNKKCPIDKGDLSLEKTVTLPGLIPPGTYTVLADVVDKDEKKITCLTASVTFSPLGLTRFELGGQKL